MPRSFASLKTFLVPTWLGLSLIFSVVPLAGISSEARAAPYLPASDDTVVETLPYKLFRSPQRAPRQSPLSLPLQQNPGSEKQPQREQLAKSHPQESDPAGAVSLARQYLKEARDLGDPRLAGYALAALLPWRDDAKAPAPIIVLQATLDQYQHDFAQARERLVRLLVRTADARITASPDILQAWLTLATIDRVLGHYADSDRSCRALGARAPLYAAACLAENTALRGQSDLGRKELSGLLALPAIQKPAQRDTRRWFLTTLAELEERAGRVAAANSMYRQALATVAQSDRDSYLIFAYADFLIAQNRFAEALRLLAHEPEPISDGALLRRAIAEKALHLKSAGESAAQLAERFEAARERGDAAARHGRELARFALFVRDDPAGALTDARENLRVQREPADLLVMAQAARAADDAAALKETAELVATQGLSDMRIDRLLRAGSGASVQRSASP